MYLIEDQIYNELIFHRLMLINNKDYKYKFRLKDIYSDFIEISNYFVKNIGSNWWLLNSSRLDLRQAGEIDLNENLDISNKKKNLFFLKLLNHIDIFKFFIINFFTTKTKLISKKNYLIIEQIKFSNKQINLVEYYFKDIFRKTNISYISIGLNTAQNDFNEIKIIRLCNFIDIIVCYFESLIINSKYNKFKLKIYTLNLYEKKFWKNYFYEKESHVNFKKLFLSKLVFRILKKNQSNEFNIFYPYEEKPYERALNLVLNNFENSSVFAYYGNPQDHHSFFLRKFRTLNIPRPKRYLCAGEFQKKQLTKYNYKKKIEIIGSCKSEKYIEKNVKYNFLVFLSHEVELETFTKWIKYNEKERDNLSFLIRMYTQLEDYKNNKHYNYLIKKKNFYFSNQSFEKDISESKFSIFSRTSAGPQAVNYGSLSIWADFSLVGSNPLFGELNNFFPSFNEKTFDSNISKLTNMSLIEIDNRLQIQKTISKKIFSKIDYQLIDYLINQNRL